MSDSSTDELLQLIKRVGAYLTLKMSNLFSGVFLTMDTRSVGAVAGLALAIIFSWRLLRSPNPRRPKRPTSRASSSGSTSQANSAMATSGVISTIEDSRSPNAADAFFQPSKQTLAQVVRQKLCEGRKVTCRLVDVILEQNSPEELQNQATVRSSVLEVLSEITKCCDLYLMERVVDDESEKRVLAALQEAGIFESGGLVKDKVLFCSTEIGRTSFVRQLEPDWHIDSNPEIVTQLARFIKYQLQVSPTRPERAAPNVFVSPSLEQFFGCM